MDYTVEMRTREDRKDKLSLYFKHLADNSGRCRMGFGGGRGKDGKKREYGGEGVLLTTYFPHPKTSSMFNYMAV